MPIFEYQCDSCGHCFEQLIFKKDDKKVNCPECGKTKVRKLISGASILEKIEKLGLLRRFLDWIAKGAEKSKLGKASCPT